ncbi:MAG: CmpA/NrtA family ABC transporter substrate-binding protein [Pseudomonadota bacterium]
MNEITTMDTQSLEKTDLNLGFIPLTDCAPLVVAKEYGYFEQYGLNVQLSKETSWANIRDKVALGILDGAQMLAGMPLAMSLGIGPMAKPMVTAFSMDLNGNAITVSNALFARMQELAPEAMKQRPLSARALKAVIDRNKKAGGEPLTFAMVFPYSTHNYELRYWMAAAGIDPDRDVQLVVVPPPQMVGQLKKGTIDGYCVGEPWNARAVQAGLGHTLITKYEIWNNSPEKVLGVTREWAEQYPNTHRALLMALIEASRRLDEPRNRTEAASLIARPIYVNAPEHVVRMSMTGTFQYAAGEMPRAMPDFNVFYRYAANFPWRSHAMWFLSQMVRWGQVEEAIDLRAVAEEVYRPEIYREAAAALGLLCPGVDYKLEGGHESTWKLHEGSDSLLMGPDHFLDGRKFDPSRPLEYLRGFDIHHMTIALDELSACNPAAHSDDQVRPTA